MHVALRRADVGRYLYAALWYRSRYDETDVPIPLKRTIRTFIAIDCVSRHIARRDREAVGSLAGLIRFLLLRQQAGIKPANFCTAALACLRTLIFTERQGKNARE